jgi:hypothetical protein
MADGPITGGMYELEPVLRAVARTTAVSLGFRTTVINLHRSAWDDFQTVVVEGSEEARRVLLGQISTWADWEPLLDARFERRGAYVIEHGAFDWSRDGLTSYVPADSGSEDPDGWHPEDALFVPLVSTAGELLGILSVDEPADGRRPTDEQLDVLVGVSQHAALALEHAQQAVAAERQRAAVDHLLRISTRLSERRTVAEMLDAVCVGIRDALGFDKVCVSMLEDGHFMPRAAAGVEQAELDRLAHVALRWSGTGSSCSTRTRRPRASTPACTGRRRATAAAAARAPGPGTCCSCRCATPTGGSSATSGRTTPSTGCCRPASCSRRSGRSRTRR